MKGAGNCCGVIWGRGKSWQGAMTAKCAPDPFTVISGVLKFSASPLPGPVLGSPPDS